jgi:hypothetical protein
MDSFPNVLTNVLTTCDDSYMNTTQTTRTITADQIVNGMRIIAPGRTKSVEIFAQLSAPESANYFEFAAFSTNGACAIRLHRSETVQVLPL